MRKQKIVAFLIALFLMTTISAIASQKESAKDSTDRTFASLDQGNSPQVEELQKESKETFEKKDFSVESSKAAPIATVSPDANIENTRTPDKTEKKKKTTGETLAGTSPSGAVENDKTPATPAMVDPKSGEMEKNWKVLFSKEITPGSIEYTVKSGDNLYDIANKYHTTADLIKKINGLKRSTIYPRMKFKIQTAPFSILVDKANNKLTLYSDGKPLKQYSVATGKNNCTPVGQFKIVTKLVNPTWFKTGTILPPGSPENALGTRWLGFDKPAYGIHGTIDPTSIGTQASEGCIRMLNENVEELYSIVPVNTQVTIQD